MGTWSRRSSSGGAFLAPALRCLQPSVLDPSAPKTVVATVPRSPPGIDAGCLPLLLLQWVRSRLCSSWPVRWPCLQSTVRWLSILCCLCLSVSVCSPISRRHPAYNKNPHRTPYTLFAARGFQTTIDTVMSAGPMRECKSENNLLAPIAAPLRPQPRQRPHPHWHSSQRSSSAS